MKALSIQQPWAYCITREGQGFDAWWAEVNGETRMRERSRRDVAHLAWNAARRVVGRDAEHMADAYRNHDTLRYQLEQAGVYPAEIQRVERAVVAWLKRRALKYRKVKRARR